MKNDDFKRVAIIGGGLSGLATAAQLRIADPRIQLTLLESSDRVGGVIHSERVGDFLIDHGADMFASNPGGALELCKKLGVEDQLIQPQHAGRGAYLLRQGSLVPIPDGFVLMRATKLWPMMTTSLLSPTGKWRVLTERFRRSDVSTDQSVADFVRGRMGTEVLDRIVGPLVAGIYTADIEKLSIHATMGPLVEMVRQHGSFAKASAARRKSNQDISERGSSGARYNQFRSFPGGMVELINAIAGSLPAGVVRTNTPVSSISSDDGRWRIDTLPDETFDYIVVATPAKVASRLIAGHAQVAADNLAAIQSSSVAIVCLGVRKSDIQRPVTTFGFVVPQKEKRRILAASFSSAKFAGRAPDDHLLVRVFIGGDCQAELLDHDDDQLLQIARDELASLIGLTGSPVVQRVVRWNESMPQYHVGHLDRVKAIDEAIGRVDGLSLISNSLRGVGIAPIITEAKRLAESIVKSLHEES